MKLNKIIFILPIIISVFFFVVGVILQNTFHMFSDPESIGNMSHAMLVFSVFMFFLQLFIFGIKILILIINKFRTDG